MATPKIMQHMHGKNPYMLNLWGNLVIHLLQLKDTMLEHFHAAKHVIWYLETKVWQSSSFDFLLQ